MMTKHEICSWLIHNSSWMRGPESISLSWDGRAMLHNAVTLNKHIKQIPFKITSVAGTFKCSDALRSLSNTPDKCDQFICPTDNNIDYENLPESRVIDLSLSSLKSFSQVIAHLKAECALGATSCAGLKSLVGISEHQFKYDITSISFSPNYIEKGGLGLLLIPGLQTINDHSYVNPDSWPTYGSGLPGHDARRAFTIISSHLGKPDALFECQQALFDADLGRFAEL